MGPTNQNLEKNVGIQNLLIYFRPGSGYAVLRLSMAGMHKERVGKERNLNINSSTKLSAFTVGANLI